MSFSTTTESKLIVLKFQRAGWVRNLEVEPSQWYPRVPLGHVWRARGSYTEIFHFCKIRHTLLDMLKSSGFGKFWLFYIKINWNLHKIELFQGKTVTCGSLWFFRNGKSSVPIPCRFQKMASKPRVHRFWLEPPQLYSSIHSSQDVLLD